LPTPRKIAKREHHRALHHRDVADFMRELREQDGVAARALEFAILTAARSGEVRGTTWSEIDLKSGMWMVPADRMKAGKEHRVPLSVEAVRVLEGMPRDGDLIFPGPKGKMLSDMALTAVLRRMEVDATAHGFRSSFRTWVAEETRYPHELAEMALAHTHESKIVAAYLRTDMVEKRRRMMSDWARHCSAPANKEKIVSFGSRVA
jgi:integrase